MLTFDSASWHGTLFSSKEGERNGHQPVLSRKNLMLHRGQSDLLHCDTVNGPPKFLCSNRYCAYGINKCHVFNLRISIDSTVHFSIFNCKDFPFFKGIVLKTRFILHKILVSTRYFLRTLSFTRLLPSYPIFRKKICLVAYLSSKGKSWSPTVSLYT